MAKWIKLLSLLGLISGAALWLWWVSSGPSIHSITLYIEPGLSGSEIGAALERSKAIDSSGLWRFITRIRALLGASLQAGEYTFPPAVSPAQIFSSLTHGKVNTYTFTIPEGITTLAVLETLKDHPKITGPCTFPPEGSLSPETFSFTFPTSCNNLLRRSMIHAEASRQALWARRPPNFPLTYGEWVILASIVEKETALDPERPHIAEVFLNRLKMGMPLQADPTLNYILRKTILSKKDLGIDSPYNTYQHRGLPPGPICIPSLKSLESVLFPTHTGDLYFVANGTGGHAFARHYQEHQSNHQEWRKIRPSDS